MLSVPATGLIACLQGLAWLQAAQSARRWDMDVLNVLDAPHSYCEHLMQPMRRRGAPAAAVLKLELARSADRALLHSPSPTLLSQSQHHGWKEPHQGCRQGQGCQARGQGEEGEEGQGELSGATGRAGGAGGVRERRRLLRAAARAPPRPRRRSHPALLGCLGRGRGAKPRAATPTVGRSHLPFGPPLPAAPVPAPVLDHRGLAVGGSPGSRSGRRGLHRRAPYGHRPRCSTPALFKPLNRAGSCWPALAPAAPSWGAAGSAQAQAASPACSP